MTIQHKIAHCQPLSQPHTYLLRLSLDAQEFGTEGLVGFVLVLAALGTSLGLGRFFLLGAFFAFLLAVFGLLLLLLGAHDLLIGQRVGLPSAHLDERNCE